MLVGAFNQEKALVGAFSVIVQLHRLIDLRHYRHTVISYGFELFSVTVKMKEAVVTQATNSLQSEVIFHCNAVLTDVIVPSSIDIDVKWLVDGKNVHSETFNAEERVSGVLTEEHWSMGQTVKMFIILYIIIPQKCTRVRL